MNAAADLAVRALRDPAAAARLIIARRPGRGALYSALLAVAAVNAILASAPVVLSGGRVDPAARAAMPLLGLLESPLALFALVAGGLLAMAHGLVWAGRALGARGDHSDMLALLTWLQALRAAAQAAILVVGLLAPAAAGLAALAAAAVALWLLLHFVSAALGLDSLFRAFGLLLLVAAGLFLGMTALAALAGAAAGWR